MVFLVAAEEHGYMELGEGAEETEVVVVGREVAGDVCPEVVLELEALGVLVVDLSAHDRRLVCAVLVGERDGRDAAELGSQEGVEGQHGAEGGVPVQEPLCVKFKQMGVDGAADFQHVVHGIACGLDAPDGGAARVHDEGDNLSESCRPQQFEGDDRVFAASDGDQVELRIEN